MLRIPDAFAIASWGFSVIPFCLHESVFMVDYSMNGTTHWMGGIVVS